jgi:hypothetical protein
MDLAHAADDQRSAQRFAFLIRRLAQENHSWGAPKIHGELQKLGLVISERSVARYLRRMRRRGDPAKRWLTFLQNHREAITAFDFFTVPTVTFQLLHCFFVIEHGRVGFCTSTSLTTRQRSGSSSNCAKRSPKRVHIDMPSSIRIPHSMTK